MCDKKSQAEQATSSIGTNQGGQRAFSSKGPRHQTCFLATKEEVVVASNKISGFAACFPPHVEFTTGIKLGVGFNFNTFITSSECFHIRLPLEVVLLHAAAKKGEDNAPRENLILGLQ